MVKVFVLVKMVIIITKPCHNVLNVTPTVLLVLLGMIVLNVPLQEKVMTVNAQQQCGTTTEFVKTVHINVKHVMVLQMIVMVTVQKTELEMIVTVQLLIMTIMQTQIAQNVNVNVPNVIKMVV